MVVIEPGLLKGKIQIPSSKSHTMRALLFALMAQGQSKIDFPLYSPDTDAMIESIRILGAKVTGDPNSLTVEGVAGNLPNADRQIECVNSGQILRFLGALCTLSPAKTTFTGDASIRNNRPVTPLISALKQLGAKAFPSSPLTVQGPLHYAKACLDGQDSQPVSALLMLGAFHPLELEVQNPGEKPWIDLTLSWLKRLNVPYVNDNYRSYKVSGGKGIDAFEYKVPGDFSSASFFKLATLITTSSIEIENLDTNDVQGDKAVLDVLDAMRSEGPMRIDVNPFIDALPVLAVAACFRKGATTLFNGAIARKKESDRIAAMAQELRKMGAILEEREDGLYIEPSSLKGAKLHSHFDHRIAMALSIAALGAKGPSEISEVECTAKSYPNFFQELKKLGGKIG